MPAPASVPLQLESRLGGRPYNNIDPRGRIWNSRLRPVLRVCRRRVIGSRFFSAIASRSFGAACFEIVITAAPFVLLWLAAWAALQVSYWLTLAITIPAAGFLVRLFLIQHDCGHGAFFRKRATNDWIGRVSAF